MEDGCGEGLAVGYTQKGEWMEYTVNVKAEGALPYALHYASGSESSGVQFFMDDEAVTDSLKLESTGDWDTYTTLKGKTKALTKGEHVFKVLITGDYVNLDWIAFGESTKGADEDRCPTTDIKPKFAQNAAGIVSKTAGEVKVFDLMGNMLGKVRLDAGASLMDLRAGLQNAGYRPGVYMVRNSAGQAVRIEIGR